MDLVNINDQVVLMRKAVKQAKVQVIRKMSRTIQGLNKKKLKDEKKNETKERKAKNLAIQIQVIKKLELDDISKFALLNAVQFDQVVKKTQVNDGIRAMARLAQHKAIEKCVNEFRNRFPDWKTQLPYLLKMSVIRKRLKLRDNRVIIKEVPKIDEGKTMVQWPVRVKKDNNNNNNNNNNKREKSTKELKNEEESDENDESMLMENEDEETSEINDEKEEEIEEEEKTEDENEETMMNEKKETSEYIERTKEIKNLSETKATVKTKDKESETSKMKRDGKRLRMEENEPVSKKPNKDEKKNEGKEEGKSWTNKFVVTLLDEQELQRINRPNVEKIQERNEGEKVVRRFNLNEMLATNQTEIITTSEDEEKEREIHSSSIKKSAIVDSFFVNSDDDENDDVKKGNKLIFRNEEREERISKLQEKKKKFINNKFNSNSLSKSSEERKLNRRERRKQEREEKEAQNIHPSWLAKKHMKSGISQFQGKRFTFD